MTCRMAPAPTAPVRHERHDQAPAHDPGNIGSVGLGSLGGFGGAKNGSPAGIQTRRATPGQDCDEKRRRATGSKGNQERATGA